MDAFYTAPGCTLYLGDSRAILPTLPAHSVDAMVTDPPAGIEFMGKAWDAPRQWSTLHSAVQMADGAERLDRPGGGSVGGNPNCRQCHRQKYGNERWKKLACQCADPDFGDAVQVQAAMQQRHAVATRGQFIAAMTEIFAECLRVLKPGGHALVWALPRTSHWTATALEDAGFEVRDVIVHLYGQGFPKSLDVGKALDKAAGAERAILETRRTQPKFLHAGDGRVQEKWRDKDTVDITAPATDLARQWDGWGTALKPASEHWILCRAPLSEPTVAANVAKHGVGALNIDAARLGTAPDDDAQRVRHNKGGYGADFSDDNWQPPEMSHTGGHKQGRWPPNCAISHTLWCSPAGVRRVRAGNQVRRGPSQRGQQDGFRYSPGDHPCNFGDPDGTETVEAWACAEGGETTLETFSLADGLSLIPRLATQEELLVGLGQTQKLLQRIHSEGTVLCDGVDHAPSMSVGPDSLDGYPACCRSCDAHAHRIQEAARVSPQRLADALVSVLDLVHSPQRSHPDPHDGLQSNWDAAPVKSKSRGKSSSKNGGGDHCQFSLFAPEPGTEGMGILVLPPSEPRDSTDSSSTAEACATAPSTACHNACIGVGFRRVVAISLKCAAWYLPITIDSQIIPLPHCPVALLDAQAGERTTHSGKSLGSKAGAKSIYGSPLSGGYDNLPGDTGGASRFMATFPADDAATRFRYVAKASTAERSKGLPPGERNPHPTTKPLALMRWLLTLVTPPGGVVLDPFAGSGSTLVAAQELGIAAIGIEQSAEYCTTARERLTSPPDQAPAPAAPTSPPAAQSSFAHPD